MKLIDLLRELKDPDLGDVAFGDQDNEPLIAQLQGAQPGSEENTKTEKELYRALNQWTAGEDGKKPAMDTFEKYERILKRGREKFPEIFKPSKPNGTKVYRGVYEMNAELQAAVKKTTKEDWKPRALPSSQEAYDAGDGELIEFYMCDKPMPYTPRSKFQSWTYDDMDVAASFANSALLITEQDDSFYFNHRVMNAIRGGRREDEIIHVGQTYKKPVYVMLSPNYYNLLFPKR